MVLAIYFKIARESMKHVIEKPDLNNFSSSDLSIIIIIHMHKMYEWLFLSEGRGKGGTNVPLHPK